jgi:hypothetical protein
MHSYLQPSLLPINKGRRSCDSMVVRLTITYAIGAYHCWCCGFESRSGLWFIERFGFRLVWWCLTPRSTIVQLFRIVAVSYIGAGNRRTRRKPPTCHLYQQHKSVKYMSLKTGPYLYFEYRNRTTIIIKRKTKL